MSWEKISIRKYEEITRVLDSNDDDLNKNLQLLSIVKDIPFEDIENMPLPQVRKMMGDISFINNPPKSKKKIPDSIDINGRKYEIFKNTRNISISQYIDFQNYLKMGGKIEQLLSVFIIPKGRKYGDGYDVVEVIDDIYNSMDISNAMNISFFFRNQLLRLTKVILTYSVGQLWIRMIMERDKLMKNQMREMIREMQGVIRLVKSGDILE